ncbi:hypothetical protein BDZ97DRAFT_1913410 [Flammula alnicola]|nr:hypothetical protein BDZ97DRAFT_1913410 [Flammula alnicola]
MPNLPPEVWLLVVQFTSRWDLFKLIGLNRVFFNTVLDLRWKRLEFSTASISYKTLGRLSDPFISNRVESMRITLYLEESNFENPFKSLKEFYRQARNNRIIRGASNLFRKGGARSTRLHNAAFTDVINTISVISPNFINIRELTIRTSYNLSPLLSYRLLRPLLSSFSGSFGTVLQELSLEGTLDEFRILLGSNPTFDSLVQLNLLFKESLPDSPTGHVDENHILVSVVAPFVNSLSPYLQSLSLKSYFPLDLSHFLTELSTFPAFHTLDVRMAFNKTTNYPASLIPFIGEKSDTLRNLALPLIPFQRFSPDVQLQEALSRWLLEFIADERCCSQLRTLEIYPTRTPAGLDILLTCIRRTSKSLREIHIRGRFFSSHENKAIIDALSQCENLNTVSLNVCRLDITLLDTLASKIPYLERIMMLIEDDVHDDGSAGISSTLADDLKERQYTDWNLKELTVKPKEGIIDPYTMSALAGSIPSLRFLGKYYTLRRNQLGM